MPRAEVLPRPESDSQDPDGGFSSATEAANLLSQVDIAGETGFNIEMNHKVEAARRSEAAAERVQLHDEAIKKAALAREILGLKEGELLSAEAAQYLETGTIEDLLAELQEYLVEGAKTGREEVLTVDRELSDARREMVELSVKKPGLLHREDKIEAKHEAERRYMQAFAGKLEQLMSTSMDKALEVGYLPQIIEKMDFGSETLTLEELAGNQLHLLTDMLCREQLMRQQVAEKASNKGARKLLNALRGSKLARGAIAGAVFTASAVTLAHGVPPDTQHVAEMTQKGIGVLAAYITSRELLEGSVEGIQGFGKRRTLRHEKKQLADDKQLADLTLRTAYNQIEAIPGDRKGTDDQEENARRFDAIQSDYAELQTAPGGKPYSAEMLMEYCSQLYLTHKEQLDRLTTHPDAQSRKQAYRELATLILSGDVEKMRAEISRGRVHRIIFRGVSLLSAAIATNYVSSIDTAQQISAAPEMTPRRI